jgi:NAD(P)-dependent dehydrogenase (short-subunit alcohol dehydrogenase family)
MRLVSDNFVRDRVPFWKVDPDVWRCIIDTNVDGPFLMARAAVPHMIKQGWGRIVNVTTGIHTMQRAGYTPYGPSKAALEASSRAWATDLHGTGVSVNVLLPGGPVDTDMLPGAVGDDRRYDGTVLKPDVIAAPVIWLVSEASNGVTGRRFIARDWDTSLPPHRASVTASGLAGFQPRTSE